MTKTNFHNIPLSDIEKMLQALAILGVLAQIVFVALNYASLPDRIPTHFDLSGQPDAYGSKKTIWFLVALSTGLFFFMRWISTFQGDKYNYPVKITPTNAVQQYLLSRQLMHAMNAGMSLLFLLICWAIIQTANGSQDGLGMWFFVALFLLIFAPIIYTLLEAQKYK